MGQPGSIDDIRPFAELAQNATTAVYKAYQTSLERFVLLKRLRPTYNRDEDLAARFQEEARIAARVQHPNVVSIYAFGRDYEGAYIVAEFVDGLDLGKVVERSRIPPDLALYVLAESARGLKAAHDKDVLHRDLKPSNILISRQGEVKLSDFGLASVSGADSPSEIRGTLAYLAPEQILKDAIDERSDLFSLGATFFEMVTGRRAFPGSTSQKIFDAILNRSPLPYLSATAGVDEEIEAICGRLLARDPSNRYPDAGAVVRAAETCLDTRGATVDASVLSAFLEDPVSFVVSTPPPADPDAVPYAAAAGPRAEASEPVVTVVPASQDAPAEEQARGRSWPQAVAAAVVLVFAGALVYAGVSLFQPTEDSANPSDARSVAGAGDVDTTATIIGVDTAAGMDHAAIAAAEAPVGADTGMIDGTGAAGTADEADSPGGFTSDGEADSPGDLAADGGADSPDDLGGADEAGSRDELGGAGGGDSRDDLEGADPAASPGAASPVEAEEEDDPPQDDARTSPAAGAASEAPAPGYVRITVDTSAAVFVDGDSVGIARAGAPLVFPFAAGERSLSLRNRSFPRDDRIVNVQSGDTIDVEHALWSTVGRLRLQVSPWADVYVDDRYVGQHPIREPLILSPTVHELRFVNPVLGVDTTTTVRIPKGETVTRALICGTSDEPREKTECQLR